MEDDVMTIVQASFMRRWFGISALLMLGALLVYLGFSTSPAPAWQAFLIALGAGALWMAEATRRATENYVELTREGLRSSSGEVIVTLDQIAGIERGAFALKPSNGFLIRLKARRQRRWQPGLWWAMGRKIGIGGVTPGSQTKVMAQMLEAMLVERSQADQDDRKDQDDQTS